MSQVSIKTKILLLINLVMALAVPSTGWAAPYVVVHGDTADVVLPNWYANCAFSTIGTVTQAADTFTVVWTDTMSEMATCTCWFDLTTTLVHIPPGSYWVKTWVGGRYMPPYDEPDTLFTGAVQFTIEGAPGTLPTENSTGQSPCHSYQSVDPDLIPSTYALDVSSYPNPFNPTTTIHYILSENTRVSVTIYDQRGRKVKTLVNADQSVGYYRPKWNGTDDSGNPLSSGVYFCQVQAGKFSETVKLVLLK